MTPVMRAPERPTAAWVCPRCHTPGTTFEAGCTNCGFNHGEKGFRAGDEPPAAEETTMAKRRRVEAEVVADPPETFPEAPTAPAGQTTVYKLIAYSGPEAWVKEAVSQSLQGAIHFPDGGSITATEVVVLDGSVWQRRLKQAGQQEDTTWKARAAAKPAPTGQRPPTAEAVQLFVQVYDGGTEFNFELADKRVVNTLSQALLHFADTIQPGGDDASLSAPECLALAEGLRKGHQL